MDFFNNDYMFISNLVEEKIPILRKYSNFNKVYTGLFDSIEELEHSLSKEQNKQLNEIIKLFYETEKYYFALAYSLGIKYGDDLLHLSYFERK